VVSDKQVRIGLYTKLNTSSVTSLLASGSASIFHEVARPGAASPYLVFSKVSGVPLLRFGGNAMDNQIWLVKAVDRSESSSRAEDIAQAADTLLDFGTLTVSGAVNLATLRESDVDYLEVDGDQTYRHHGARYRIYIA
jgi:hypothetical protein